MIRQCFNCGKEENQYRFLGVWQLQVPPLPSVLLKLYHFLQYFSSQCDKLFIKIIFYALLKIVSLPCLKVVIDDVWVRACIFIYSVSSLPFPQQCQNVASIKLPWLCLILSYSMYKDQGSSQNRSQKLKVNLNLLYKMLSYLF